MSMSLKQSLLVGSSAIAFAFAAAPAFAQAADQQNETVIVTGTRVQGMTAADSAAPITVLGADALVHGNGSADLRDQLGQEIPSFTSQYNSGDTGNLTLSAALRGLSPNDTLVLVDGHRRHYPGNIQVDSGGFAAPDLGLIPQAAIDHVEVLLDGAAAQYGTDAIAGVVNIILKNKSSGGQFSATAGDYFNRGGSSAGIGNTGEKYDIEYNMGLPLFDKGFVNFTVEKRFENFTQWGTGDTRYVNAQNQPVAQTVVTGVGSNGVATLSSTGNQIPNTFLPGIVGYPRANPTRAEPQSQITQGELNSAYDFSDDVQLYSFGTLSHRFAKSYENVRLPNQIIATLGSNQPCSASNPNGYATGSSTANGLSASCTGPYTLAGSVGAPGAANAGLNSSGIVISSGNAGNLFSSTLINAQTGALLPSATGESTLGTEPELVLYPNDMRPQEILKQDDYQYNLGVKFNVVGWDVDADVGYGKDINNLYTWNSGDRTLFLDTHTTPTNFYDGSETASQFTGTIDATRPFNVGLASPLTVAVGAEAREDAWGLGAGEPLSYFVEGPVSYPGFPTSVAGMHSRKNYAGYVDFAVAPIEQLTIDVAGRYEKYTDFGSTEIGKITARYDITPQWAIRGTISTGFRAPTLSEEYYTAVNVNIASATLQLPADSAAARLLGINNLKPEISTSFSAGIVARPLEDLFATLDAYSIAIGNRITSSTSVSAFGGSINTPLVSNAIALAGVTLDPTVTQQGVTAFINGVNTLTQGVDWTVTYPTDLGQYGMINWTAVGNYNTTAIAQIVPVPAVLLASNPNASFFNFESAYNYAHIMDWKGGLTANWSLDQYGATLRETYYGPRHGYTSPNSGGELIPANQAGVGLTDLEVRYNITDQLQFAFGADNIFNIKPDSYGAAPSCAALPSNVLIEPGGSCAAGPNQSNGETQTANNEAIYHDFLNTGFDPNGGYYYGRITFNF